MVGEAADGGNIEWIGRHNGAVQLTGDGEVKINREKIAGSTPLSVFHDIFAIFRQLM
jgi:hypothetical protein